MTLLSVNNLTVRLGSRTVLAEVYLPDVSAGQLVGVLGPNGSGKSTLLRTMAGLSHGSGEITFAARDGEPVRRVYMPQSLPSPSSLLAYELLIAHARAMGDRGSNEALERRVAEVFASLKILDLALRPIAELSGGQRQLVGYALAISRTPHVLLLDEPTSALDIRWQLKLIEHVRMYVQQHDAACVIAVHDIGLAARCCDVLVLLDQGHVAAAGPPRTVLTEDNLAAVYGVRTKLYQRSDGHLGVEILGPVMAEPVMAEERHDA